MDFQVKLIPRFFFSFFFRKTEDGIQSLEAMIYAVQKINDDPYILPGIKLGILAFDSCDNPNYSLEQTFKFVKGIMS